MSESGQKRDYIVVIEKDTGLKADTVAQTVANTLNDPRGWAGDNQVRFGLIKDQAKVSFTVAVLTPTSAAKACGTAAVCWSDKKVIVNATLWNQPPTTYADDTLGFQRYLVNHGVGLMLGNQTKSCAGAGKAADVMQPQYQNLDGCKANPWVNTG